MEYPRAMPRRDVSTRPIVAAELLSIGSELTTGETRDTNAAELARGLSGHGVTVLRIQALPDDLGAVTEAFAGALERADVVVSTGGLGPTPDDLTREAIAAATGETAAIDADLEAWLRSLWDRRGLPFADMNLKQAWLIPSATEIPNHNGTAPGWWIERPDGRIIVALPGPPREMRPMWADWVAPRLLARGPAREQEVRTLRLTGIGESQVAERLGESLLRAANPIVATYARSDAVDVRIAARPDAGNGSTARSAVEVASAAEAEVLSAVGEHVWARGETTWPAAIGERLGELGWRAAVVEIGLGGELTALFGDATWLERSESRREANATGAGPSSPSIGLEEAAERARRDAGTDVGMAVRAAERGLDMAVSVAVATPLRMHTERRLAFLGGSLGRSRAALTAAAVLLAELHRDDGRSGARAGSEARQPSRRVRVQP